MSSEISIPNVTVEDDGIYICTATLDSTSIEHTSVRVIVHGEYVIDKLYIYYIYYIHNLNILLHFLEHPFLNVTHGTPAVVTAEEGKRWEFNPQVNALPAPDTIMW